MTLLLTAALALASSPGGAAPAFRPAPPASVQAYFERLEAVFRADSDAADVDRLLALFHLEGGRIGRVEELW